jgi:CHASE2 domain-containing sensor protein/signal transduction histidine kinase
VPASTDSNDGHAPAVRTAARSSLRWRGLPEFAITLLAGFLLLATLVWTPAGSAVGKRIYDQLSIWIGFQASPEVVLVAIDERTRLALGGWPISRAHFATLIERLLQEGQAPRVLGLDLLFTNAVAADEPLAEQMARLPVVLPKVMSQALPVMQASPAADTWQWTPPALERAARSSGHIHVRFESDGIIRGVQTRLGEQWHFSIAMLEAAGLLSSRPLPPADYLRFPMVDPAVGFRTYSLIDLLDVNKPLPPLRGNLLFLGVTDPVLGDQHATIYSGSATAATPGVAILASVANAHLTDRWVRVIPDAVVMGCSSLALLAFMSVGLLWRPGRMRLLVYALGLGLPVGATAALIGWGWWFDFVPLWLTLLVVTLVWIWRRLDGNLRYMYRKSKELRASSGDRQAAGAFSGEMERVEQALDHAIDLQAHQLDLLAQAIEHLPEALALIDAQGQVLQVNVRMAQLCGSLEGGAGPTLAQLAGCLGLPGSQWHELTELAERTEESLSITGPAGSRDVYIKTNTFNTSQAHGLRLLTLVDVTELKQSQAQRDQALRFLSHDMRTPVASILAVTQQMKALGRGHEQWLAEVGRVTVHADQLMHLMDGFLFESRAHSQEWAVSERLVDDLLEDAISQVRDLARAREMRIEVHDSEQFFFVQVSTMLMVRAFMNLMLNAIKYGQPGTTLDISMHTSGTEVDIVMRNQVAHDTLGIDESIITQGFGLGLTFVRTVVRRHQGQLFTAIESAGGQARVCVRLPCVIESA